MRTLLILSLIVGFAVAVIAPNDIGTQNLPATGANGLVVKAHADSDEPVTGESTTFVTAIAQDGETIFRVGTFNQFLRPNAPCFLQRDPRLVI